MTFKMTGADKFVQQLGKMNQGLKTAVSKSLGVVGLAILEDTINQEPTPPFETGYLRGAQFMYVQGVRNNLANALQNNGEDGKEFLANNPPATAEIKLGEFVLEVGLNTPYALYQHENLGVSISPTTVSKKGTPKNTSGVNGKFLELKLLRNKDQYVQIFANEFTKRWGK